MTKRSRNAWPVAPEDVVAELRRLGKADRIEATQNYYPSAQENLGVYAKDIRSIVRSCCKQLREVSAKDVLEFALALIAENTLEGRQCAYEIIAGHKAAVEALGSRKLEALMKGVDNWASTDSFACTLSGAAWREGRLHDRDVERWSRSKDPWIRRVALVSTVPLNMKSRGGSGDVERTVKACKRAVEDDHLMVQKALSWALRTLAPISASTSKQFLRDHAESIPAFVKREVEKKLKTGRKSG